MHPFDTTFTDSMAIIPISGAASAADWVVSQISGIGVTGLALDL